MRLRTTEILRAMKAQGINKLRRGNFNDCPVGVVATSVGIWSDVSRYHIAKKAKVKAVRLIALEMGFEDYPLKPTDRYGYSLSVRDIPGVYGMTQEEYDRLRTTSAYRTGQRLAKLSGY